MKKINCKRPKIAEIWLPIKKSGSKESNADVNFYQKLQNSRFCAWVVKMYLNNAAKSSKFKDLSMKSLRTIA